MHLASPMLPFGGAGPSGFGAQLSLQAAFYGLKVREERPCGRGLFGSVF